MEQIVLIGIKLDELIEKLDSFITTKLDQNKIIQPSSIYLTRNESAKLLKISLPTLSEWTKQGWLKSYTIGRKVFYKKDEIEEAVTNTSKLKYSRMPE